MFSSRVSGKRLSHKKRFRELAPHKMAKYEPLRDKIIAAFWRDGIHGIMVLINRSKCPAYALAAKFGLLKERAARRNSEALADLEAKNLKTVKKVWGWQPGDDSITLKRRRVYRARKPFMVRTLLFRAGKVFAQYTIPRVGVRKWLVNHGVRYFYAGDMKIPVRRIKSRNNSLSLI
jgi:hypothetical protein